MVAVAVVRRLVGVDETARTSVQRSQEEEKEEDKDMKETKAGQGTGKQIYKSKTKQNKRLGCEVAGGSGSRPSLMSCWMKI